MQLNHIIIGAGRSGTTSLVAYLKQHPDVSFSNIKEVTYFSVDDHYNRGESYLHSFFEPNDKSINATSDTYLLMSKQAPKRIAEYNKDIKLAVILREPSDRAYSNYHFSVNNGHHGADLSFKASEQKEKAVLDSGAIIDQNNHCHFYGSLYHLHLTHWLKHFDPDQLFICTTKELKETPKALMNRYFEFLGLKDFDVQEIQPLNVAASAKNESLNQFLVNRDHWLRRLVRWPLKFGPLRKLVLQSSVVDKVKRKNQQSANYSPMTIEEREFCNVYFKDDLRKLKEDFGISF